MLMYFDLRWLMLICPDVFRFMFLCVDLYGLLIYVHL